VVTQEPATLQGDAPSFREFLAEHRQSALRLGPGRFVLQHIPMSSRSGGIAPKGFW
jgi:hypothetical protein